MYGHSAEFEENNEEEYEYKWAVYLCKDAGLEVTKKYAVLKGFSVLETINPGEGFWVNCSSNVIVFADWLGSYDALVNEGEQAAARVELMDSGEISILIRIGVVSTLGAKGVQDSDGTWILETTMWPVLNFPLFGTGLATIKSDDQHWIITGHMQESGGGTYYYFSMTRPFSGTWTSFSGEYRISFPQSPTGCGCTSSIYTTFEVDSFGNGKIVGVVRKSTRMAIH